jgi:hypothetical protein
MFGWIKNNIGFKNLLILLTVILVIAGLSQGPALYKKYKKSQFEGPITAELINIVPEEAIAQHLTGPNTVIIGYHLSYVYKVGDEEFSNTEFVSADYDVALLYSKFSKGEPILIEIKYSGESAKDCYISNLKTEILTGN